MPQPHLVPRQTDYAKDHADRIGRVERETIPVVDSRRVPFVFDWHGPLSGAVDVKSPAWRPYYPARIILSMLDLNEADSTGVVVECRLKSGLLVRSLSIGAGDVYNDDARPFVVPRGEALTLTVTAGDDGEDLAVSFSYELLGSPR